ncbi:hypothetical protein HETIRDRAFT_314935 [Heterobasidion irregulare TC 32-1]|uniref:Protein kinase domain-containing protein n=1 Tax=Heterobasidion irregulare (strain TC 32-1) TaxID=747525 RepID=W4K9T3_HETIT|nr:uncharacterized protein HETIRDRAFT_314935 [Heterobasidion irregulare TC 32-1]ETW82607.1 hypothetical protein HETIRDRAFT_314935 [Heterobasidion irregulare TC 32-1]
MSQQLQLLQSTPVSNKKSSTERFQTREEDSKASGDYKALVKEMRNQFIGPMPIDAFFNAFMPDDWTMLPKDYQQCFKALTIETDFETNFIQAVKDTGLCPDLFLVDTTMREDTGYKRKPDISIYKERDKNESSANFFLMELHIERKRLSEDPFVDPKSFPEKPSKLPTPEPTQPRKEKIRKYSAKESKLHVFEHNSNAGNKSRGQITSYAAAQLGAQCRTFLFSIIFIDNFVRFIRWDRAGAIVTERVNWKDDPSRLAMFLWRFSHSSDSARGHDTTVSIPTSDEITCAKVALKQYALEVTMAQGGSESDILKAPFSSDDSFRKFRVLDDEDRREHFFVASHPEWYTNSPTGRGTKGYVAYDIATGKVVYLKDSWRYVAEGYKKEGETYRDLLKANVQRIPRLLCSSDIDGQETRTHQFYGEPWCSRVSAVKHHQHHRLVLRDLGRPLRQYNSTKELSQVILDSIEAHQQAYDAGVLHQDISGGNILITNDGRGLLIDWDLSRRTDSKISGARLKMRTGTWQFMSLGLLRHHGKEPHELRHDLESFLYVYLYHCIRYQMRALSENDRFALLRDIHAVFDYAVQDASGRDIGGDGKNGFMLLIPAKFSSEYLSTLLCSTAVDIISDLRELFVPLYAPRSTKPSKLYTTKLPSKEDAQDSLKSSKPLRDIFSHIDQQDWVDDRSDCLLGKQPLDFKTKRSNKRKAHPASTNDSSKSNSETKKLRLSSALTSDISASTLIWDDGNDRSDFFSS